MRGHQQYCNHNDHNKSEEKVNKQKRGLMKYGDLPEYLKDNEYILDYYRCEWPLKDAFLSIFSWHNETLNVWTHLVGFLIFATLTVMSLTEDGGGLISNFSRKQVSSPMMTTKTMMKNDTNVSDNHDVFPAGGSSGIVFVWDLWWQKEPIVLCGAGEAATHSLSKSEVWEVHFDSNIISFTSQQSYQL